MSDAMCSTPHLPSLADERVAEEEARLILIVRAAAELDVVRRGGASGPVRLDVVELQECCLAASACASNKGALSFIAQPHGTPDSRWYVAPRWRTFARVRPR